MNVVSLPYNLMKLLEQEKKKKKKLLEQKQTLRLSSEKLKLADVFKHLV